MIGLKRFLGTFVIIAIMVATACKVLVFFENINGTAGLFIWLAVMVAYCGGYGMRMLDEAKVWPHYPTEEEVRNVAVSTPRWMEPQR